MTTITLSPGIEKPHMEQARRQGITPEQGPVPESRVETILFDFLQG